MLQAEWKKKRELVEAALIRELEAGETLSATLADSMRYSLLAGGKRLRPILLMAAAEAVGGKGEDYLTTACAIEMIHTYSLIHDDLPGMDDDDMRRGRPTVHKAFDEATAILAGDALLTLAFEVAANANLEARQLVEAVKILSSASGMSGMISGQMKDIASEEVTITLEQMKEILSVDAEGWKKEIADIRENHYPKFGNRLPKELTEALNTLEKRLG